MPLLVSDASTIEFYRSCHRLTGVMDLAALVSSLALVALAELGDKTQLMAITLSA